MERRCSFHERLLACIRFFAENDNYLRGSFGSGVTSPYAQFSLEGSCSFIRAYICRRNSLQALPDELHFYVQMYVFSCMCAFNERSSHRWDMTEEQLALLLERGMPEPLKPYLLN